MPLKVLRYLVGAGTLLAGILGAVYIWSLLGEERSPGEFSITLLFENAAGLAPGAAVRYRGVWVGEVVGSPTLGGDGEFAEVTCSLIAKARPTLRANSQFWIVRPLFRGLTQGASGLETLIKDSYLAYSTGPGNAPLLREGTRIPGLSAPPGSLSSVMPARPGDLGLSVLLPDSATLGAGSPVRFRGTEVGVVTSVDLAPGGDGVIAQARIQRQFRDTVTDATVFWAARPGMRGGLISGMDFHHLDVLLGGAYLEYFTPPGPPASPAEDGSLFTGASKRPEIDWEPPPLDSLRPARNPAETEARDPLSRSLVKVHYSFSEEDLLSPDDHYSQISPGLLFRSVDGLAVVLVARAAVDATWIASDGWGDLELSDEVHRVTLPDGSVINAGLVWVADDGEDLALLNLATVAPAPIGVPVSFDDVGSTVPGNGKGSVLEVVFLDAAGKWQRSAVTLRENGTLAGIGKEAGRGILLRDGRAIGAVTTGPRGERVPLLVPFSSLPSSLRGSSL
ncbi:MAG: MlaD family protein [Planctomycetota bacterium]